jgi:hypothetical protein
LTSTSSIDPHGDRQADVGGSEEDDPPIPDGEQLRRSRRSGTAPAPHGIAVAAMVYLVALMGKVGVVGGCC